MAEQKGVKRKREREGGREERETERSRLSHGILQPTSRSFLWLTALTFRWLDLGRDDRPRGVEPGQTCSIAAGVSTMQSRWLGDDG